MVSCTKDTLNLTHNFICWSENRHGRFQPCLTSREYYEEKINISMFPKERSLEISKHLLIASIWVHSDSHHYSRFTLYSAHWVLTSTIAFFISTSSLWYPTSFFSYILTSFYYNVDDFLVYSFHGLHLVTLWLKARGPPSLLYALPDDS